ncbi:hypothetical protein W909_06455 [Dickeya zeae EC1]|nr:hypothetical protein W909_06455 [Dickeya zeae EC1]
MLESEQEIAQILHLFCKGLKNDLMDSHFL